MRTERAQYALPSPPRQHDFFFPAELLKSLSNSARLFAIRLRNGCENRGQNWMNIAHVHIARAAEIKNNKVNELLSELKDKRLITISKDGPLLRLTLVKQGEVD